MFVVVVVFILSTIIDIQLAIFISVVCAAILIIRKMILGLNPIHGKNKKINYNGKQLTVSSNIEVFELKDYTSFETLCNYAEALRFISKPPATLIIRFSKKSEIDKSSAEIICKVVKRLYKVDVRIVFSDIDVTIFNQLEYYDIIHIIGGGNLFSNIEEALGASTKRLVIKNAT